MSQSRHPNSPQPHPKQSILNSFLRLDRPTQIALLGLALTSVGLLVALLWHVFNQSRVYTLKYAAGDKEGESYILAKAIEQVVEAQQPNIQIEVIETGGTSESLQLLEAGEAQLVAAQADVPAGVQARKVAILYRDLFQIVVRNNSGINEFSQLRGRRIGLQQTGGQFRSFLAVAEHYGLKPENFVFVGDSDRAADEAFRKNQVDALFRVRAPGHQPIAELVQGYQGQLLPIDQAEAMKIKYPAFEPADIPKGAYRGSPAAPTNNLPTVGVQRLLLARDSVNDNVVRDITRILNEYRQQIADAISEENADVKPLVSYFDQPTTTGGTGIPTHAGADAYYGRNQPSFVQENADFLGLLLTIGLLLGSWLWQVKSWLEQRRKNLADQYVGETIQLIQASQSSLRPEDKLQALNGVFEKAAIALRNEKISQESFRTFNEAYKTVREVLERDLEQEKKQTKEEREQRTKVYIQQVLALSQKAFSDTALAEKQLNDIFQKVQISLVRNEISEESFRTFMEVYKILRIMN